jgi:stearoyl-CoA desaturase (Delta-9 desaturase)
MSANPSRVRAKVSITVDNEALRSAQRRNAIVTIVVPFLGTLAAVGMAVTNGISALDIGLLVTTFVLINFGLEVGFHRYFAHKAFATSRFMTLLMAILGSMAAEGSLLYWAAGHRRHHAHSDTGDDPHSPHRRTLQSNEEAMRVLRGLWHSHIGWMMSDKVTNCTLFAKDILRDPALNRIHQLYVPIVLAGLAIPGILGGLITLSWSGALSGFLWGGLVRMFLLHHSTWSNASISHVFGGRPFNSGDLSANNFWCAIPTFGASWQNNHHMFPASAYLGLEWWQIDIGAWFIRGLAACGLVWEVKGPPPPETMAAAKRAVS